MMNGLFDNGKGLSVLRVVLKIKTSHCNSGTFSILFSVCGMRSLIIITATLFFLWLWS